MTRRELVLSVARLAALTALGTTAGVLLARSGGDDGRCRPDPCSGCARFEGCDLPRASATRREVERG